MTESVFYQNGIVKVTKTMFEAGSTQIPIRNISSVKRDIISPERNGPGICIGLGGMIITIGVVSLQFSPILIGLPLLAAGVYWWNSQKPTYLILITSGGTPEKVYSSENSDEISEILSALNAAIAQH